MKTLIFDPFLALKKIIDIIIKHIAPIANYFTNCNSEDIIMNRNTSQTCAIPNIIIIFILHIKPQINAFYSYIAIKITATIKTFYFCRIKRCIAKNIDLTHAIVLQI